MSPETGTIAGVASALAMALIGAVSSYISYQQKKFCFRIQRKWIHPVATCGSAHSNFIPPIPRCEQMVKVFQGKGAETWTHWLSGLFHSLSESNSEKDFLGQRKVE